MSRKIAIALMILAFPSIASGAELTIDDALDDVDELAALQDRNEADVRALKRASDAASKWSGPAIGFEWSDVRDMESELEVTVGQSIPIDGAPGARARALEVESEAAELRGAARIQDYKAHVADAFYEALYRQKRLVVLQDRIDAVTRTRLVLQRREAAGDASQFEVERVDREVRRLQASMERERADAAAALAELASLLMRDDAVTVTGELAAQCGGEASTPPQIAALETESEAALVRAEQGDKSWWPTLEVEAGGVMAAPPGEPFNPGYKVGFGLAFPIWGGTSAIVEAAEARAAALDAERALLNARAERRAKLLSDRCASLTQTAETLRSGIPSTAKLLTRAEAGYAAGELTLLELLDAQQAVLEERLDLLDLSWSARRAQNDWKTTVGGW